MYSRTEFVGRGGVKESGVRKTGTYSSTLACLVT